MGDETMINNQKGLTLIEVLAALTITAVLIGAATMLLSSIYLEWNTSTNTYNYNSDVDLAMTTISKNIAHCNAIYAFNTSSGPTKEWRLKTGEGATAAGVGIYRYKSLVYTTQIINGTSKGILTLYEISSAQFSSKTTAIDYTTSTNYSNKLVLADNLSASSAPTLTNNSADISSLQNGELVTVMLPFQYIRAQVNKVPVVEDKPKTFTIKLIVDTII
jgi:prepilin-type N-terminal cleavage/methylation domain-containing protein